MWKGGLHLKLIDFLKNFWFALLSAVLGIPLAKIYSNNNEGNIFIHFIAFTISFSLVLYFLQFVCRKIRKFIENEKKIRVKASMWDNFQEKDISIGFILSILDRFTNSLEIEKQVRDINVLENKQFDILAYDIEEEQLIIKTGIDVNFLISENALLFKIADLEGHEIGYAKFLSRSEEKNEVRFSVNDLDDDIYQEIIKRCSVIGNEINNYTHKLICTKDKSRLSIPNEDVVSILSSIKELVYKLRKGISNGK